MIWIRKVTLLRVGVNPEDKHSIYDVISANTSIKDSIYSTPWPGISIIPSHISLTGGEIELVNIEGREMRLREELHKIKEDFSYIIIDAPPSLGLLTVNVLVAADSVLIPSNEYYALEGVSKLLVQLSH